MSLPSPRASRALLALTVVAAGVFGSGLAANAGSTGTRPSALPTLVKSAPASVLVNAQGMTLYVFAHDKMNTSNCYDTSAFKCATYWPPLLLPTHYVMHNASAKSTWGVAMRKDGSRQLTYYGAPLYTWIKDKKPGDMTGQGVGGVWWVVTV